MVVSGCLLALCIRILTLLAVRLLLLLWHQMKMVFPSLSVPVIFTISILITGVSSSVLSISALRSNFGDFMEISVKFFEKSNLCNFKLVIKSFCFYSDCIVIVDLNDQIHLFNYHDVLSLSIYSSDSPFLIESR